MGPRPGVFGKQFKPSCPTFQAMTSAVPWSPPISTPVSLRSTLAKRTPLTCESPQMRPLGSSLWEGTELPLRPGDLGAEPPPFPTAASLTSLHQPAQPPSPTGHRPFPAPAGSTI